MPELPPVAIQPDTPNADPLIVAFSDEPKEVVDSAILDDRGRLATSDSPIARTTNELRVVGSLLLTAGLLHGQEPAASTCAPIVEEALAHRGAWYRYARNGEIGLGPIVLRRLSPDTTPDITNEDTLLAFYAAMTGAMLFAIGRAADEFRLHPDIQQTETRTEPDFDQLFRRIFPAPRHILGVSNAIALDARAAHQEDHAILGIEARALEAATGSAILTAIQRTADQTIVNVATPFGSPDAAPRSVSHQLMITESALRQAAKP